MSNGKGNRMGCSKGWAVGAVVRSYVMGNHMRLWYWRAVGAVTKISTFISFSTRRDILLIKVDRFDLALARIGAI